MNTSASPVPGVFHFLQHGNVTSQDWQALCQAITTAYLKLHWQPPVPVRQQPDEIGHDRL